MNKKLSLKKQALQRELEYDHIENLVKDFLNKCDEDGEKQHLANALIHTCAIWGSNTVLEGIGILEHSKFEYIKFANEVAAQEN